MFDDTASRGAISSPRIFTQRPVAPRGLWGDAVDEEDPFCQVQFGEVSNWVCLKFIVDLIVDFPIDNGGFP